MFKKIAVGGALVVLSLGIAVPASAESKVTDDQVTPITPGFFCIWLS